MQKSFIQVMNLPNIENRYHQNPLKQQRTPLIGWKKKVFENEKLALSKRCWNFFENFWEIIYSYMKMIINNKNFDVKVVFRRIVDWIWCKVMRIENFHLNYFWLEFEVLVWFWVVQRAMTELNIERFSSKLIWL